MTDEVLDVVSSIVSRAAWAMLLMMVAVECLLPQRALGQNAVPDTTQTAEGLQQRVGELEDEVAELKRMVKELQTNSQQGNGSANSPSAPNRSSADQTAEALTLTPQDKANLGFLRDTTINIGLDGYYDYNFNAPVGRVNLLRAYDVLSNSFSLNQASLIFDHPTDVANGRRLGGRLDLQFGQATDTLQGNPLNEPRPDIYRNIFQAYGTYVVTARPRFERGFWKVGELDWDRRQLHQRSDQLLAIILV